MTTAEAQQVLELEERATCPLCKRTFKNEQGLRVHYGRAHSGEPFPEAPAPEPPAPEPSPDPVEELQEPQDPPQEPKGPPSEVEQAKSKVIAHLESMKGRDAGENYLKARFSHSNEVIDQALQELVDELRITKVENRHFDGSLTHYSYRILHKYPEDVTEDLPKEEPVVVPAPDEELQEDVLEDEDLPDEQDPPEELEEHPVKVRSKFIIETAARQFLQDVFPKGRGLQELLDRIGCDEELLLDVLQEMELVAEVDGTFYLIDPDKALTPEDLQDEEDNAEDSLADEASTPVSDGDSEDAPDNLIRELSVDELREVWGDIPPGQGLVIRDGHFYQVDVSKDEDPEEERIPVRLEFIPNIYLAAIRITQASDGICEELGFDPVTEVSIDKVEGREQLIVRISAYSVDEEVE